MNEPGASSRDVAARQVVRFVVVGVLNTAFSYGVYAGLVFVGVPYTVANLVAIALGIVFSFKTQGAFVFANTDNRRLLRFAGMWGCIYAVNVLLIGLFMRHGAGPYLAGALAIPFATALSFVGQKYFVFRTVP